MTLTINNIVLDEEYRTPATGPADETEVSSATYLGSQFRADLDALALNLLSSPAGFPQLARNGISSTNPVTDYSLSLSSATGVATTLFVGSNQVFLFPTADPDIVVGRIGSGTTADAGGAVALMIGVDDSAISSASVWVGLYAPLAESGLDLIDSADQLDLTGLVALDATFTTTTSVPFENFDGLPSGNNLFNVIWPSDNSAQLELLVTGSRGTTLSTVNVSTTGIGAGSQAIDVGATLRFDAVQGMTRSTVDTAPEVNQASNIAYHDLGSDADLDARVELTGADFEVTQVNPGNPNDRVDIRLSAFNVAGADQGQAYLTGINANGTAVTIDWDDVIILDGSGKPAIGVTVVQDGASVIIRGLDDGLTNNKLDGYQVFFTTDAIGFDRFTITNIDSKDTLDVGNIHVTVTESGTGTESTDLGAHLIFQDDGPRIGLAAGATLPTITDDDSDFTIDNTANFAGLFGPADYGADGAGSLRYQLGVKGAGVDSGLDDTLTGQNVVLSYDAGTNTVYGRTQGSGLEVFRITVDASGIVTLDQSRAVVHTDPATNNENSVAMAADLISLTARVVDSEASGHNDSASATADIGGAFLFRDDGPAITGQAVGSLTPNDLQVANLVGASDSSAYTLTAGHDGQNSFVIQGPADSSGDFTWQYFDVDGSGTAGLDEIKGFYRGSELYTLEVNSDGTYTFNLTGTLAGTEEGLSSTIIHAGGPADTVDVAAASPSTDFGRIIGDSTVGAGLINASHGVVGVDNGNLDNGESINLSLHKATGEFIDVGGVTISTKSAGVSHYDYFVTFSDGSVVQVGDDVTVGKNGTISVLDPDATDDLLIESVTIVKVDGNALKIGLGDIKFIIPPSDVQLGFTVAPTDGDNDVATTSFTVDIDGNRDGVYGATTNSLSVVSGEVLQPLVGSLHTYDQYLLA